MLLPIRTSIKTRQTPYANYALIVLNVLIYTMEFMADPYSGRAIYRPWVQTMMLIPVQWQYWQLLTYAFLHAHLWHIIGNMLFLYIFGNSVNDTLGHVKYLCFYLGGAIFSGMGHVLLNMNSGAPTLGASGAVAAVTGAYLVLFPQTLVTVLYWFIIIGTLEIPAIWFIGLKLILIDNILAASADGVAYDAHIAGYVYGIGIMVLCVAAGWIQKSQFDLWAMIQQWNRRRQYRDVVSSGYDPFGANVGTAARRQVRARVVPKTPEQLAREAQILTLRQTIISRISERNLASAAQAYLELMAVDNSQILAHKPLLDVANQLASEGRYAESARAYEQVLQHYKQSDHPDQVMLMLGLIYARYLHRADLAIEHLSRASERLTNPDQLALCQDELKRLKTAL
ncbi:MAG: rhomboid family intramembrane serine protease [Phycisphaerae bacterium]|nr:rhomboid family intramembrane serine protease [Phycisphaerae bacterium]